MLTVLEINDVESLAGLRLAWNALLAETRGASYFRSLDWLEAYWQCHGDEQRMRVLVVRQENQTVGILPLVVRAESNRLGTLRVLTYPLHDWGPFYGPLGPNPTATLHAAMGYLNTSVRDWDVIDLRWTHTAGWDRGRTAHAMRMAGFPPTASQWTQTAFVDLSSGWDAYWASRKTHWRTNVRRSEKKLTERGEVRHVRYRPLGAAYGDDDPRWDLYEICTRLASQSWQGNSSTGTTLSHDAIRNYLRTAHARAAAVGALDMNLLFVDNVPAAFAYNYCYQGHVSGLRMGFDASVAKDGAGSTLQHRMLRDSAERGDHTFDLGPAYLDCKRNWLTSIESSDRYVYYAPAPKPQLVRFKRWLGTRRTAKATS